MSNTASHMPQEVPPSEPMKSAQGFRWMREPECLLLLGLVLVFYLVRLPDLSLRGEEPRRGQVAIEMLQTGDWITPRQQGTLFFSRPPLQNWIIAGLGVLRGGVDVWAIRLPSSISVLLTCFLIYGYARTFLTATGALLAGASYCTMGQVLELGRLGETEAFYTLVVAGSLILWHWGWTQKWSPLATWSAAYFLAAMGMLAKGPQAPIYFAAAVGLYLLATRNWRALLAPAHFAGILLFAVIWAAWQIPYSLQNGNFATFRMYQNDIAMRFEDTSWLTLVEHLGLFPLEILACLLPWSVLLLVYCRPGFWRGLGSGKSQALFLLGAIAITFPTCWFTPGAKTRYFMPLYPCFALLVGLAAQQCWTTTAAWRHSWSRFQVFLAGTMLVSSIAAIVVTIVWPTETPVLAVLFAIFFSTSCVGLAWATWRTASAETTSQQRIGVLAVSAFIGLMFTGLVTNLQIRGSNDIEQQLTELKEKLPPHTPLVSFDLIDSAFTYHYAEPVELVDPMSDWMASSEYFCFDQHAARRLQEAGLKWEEVGVVSCARTRNEMTERRIIVARRLDGPTTQVARMPATPLLR
ncbi:ArnT family glycosyltransferase [Lignipirellula cremea]|uniref:Undecaprenyl phosphate-alpha-4-amino-4-deoxy-L-arabinose arabinosyl transferase n=1 Tax=Lignipirellula cremea TaxID=2528010 RepID=A0A518DUP0_9BACT|nr:glycosyltransferase family 39 protein [Lignipirellula cremea]QDU95555.1 Undecaprenyl phosphate-alpha-4-amino-4-deoxy-L-arabinose arabinosyl transferase [Lignipirellula cremea]